MHDIFTDLNLTLNNLTVQKQMTKNEFIEEVYELAFGDNAINRQFSYDEVLEELKKFSDNALIFEESGLSEDDFEKIDEKIEASYKDGYRDGSLYQLEKSASDYGVGK